MLPVAETVVHTHASPRSAVGFLIHAAGLPRDKIEPHINLTMPGVCCTVAEQIEALRRVAGDKVAARIRREPDALIVRIVDGWPQRLEAKRATALGFEAVRPAGDDAHDQFVRPRRMRAATLSPATRRSASICSATVQQTPGMVRLMRGSILSRASPAA